MATVGLKDLKYAPLTKDDSTGVTYGAVAAIAGAINAKISPKSDTAKLYSDDTVSDILTSMSEIEVELEVKDVPLEVRASLLGHKVVKGVLIENKDDIAPEVAIGFRSKKSNGKYRYIWLLKGKFELFDDEFATEEDKPKFTTPKLKATFVPRVKDGNWRFVSDEDGTGVDSTIITSWFTAVPVTPTTP